MSPLCVAANALVNPLARQSLGELMQFCCCGAGERRCRRSPRPVPRVLRGVGRPCRCRWVVCVQFSPVRFPWPLRLRVASLAPPSVQKDDVLRCSSDRENEVSPFPDPRRPIKLLRYCCFVSWRLQVDVAAQNNAARVEAMARQISTFKEQAQRRFHQLEQQVGGGGWGLEGVSGALWGRCMPPWSSARTLFLCRLPLSTPPHDHACLRVCCLCVC